MQAELGGFAHGTDKEKEADHGQCVELAAEDQKMVLGEFRGTAEHHIEFDRIEQQIDAAYTKGKADIADAIDQKCLDGSGAGGRLGVPEPNQQIGHQAHPFPAEEQLQEIVGGDQCQHEEGKERQDTP